MVNTIISNEVIASFAAFQNLVQHLSNHDGVAQNVRDEFQRQLDRFKTWIGNIGAHKQGQSSLDFRLRDASHIVEAVVNMLKRLKEMLSETQSSLFESEPLTQDHDADHADEDLEYLQPLSLAATLENVLDFVTDTVKALLRISMAIQNPASQNRYLKAKTIDTSFYETHDIDHVRALYQAPSVPDFLVKRLGRANTSRRQFLKYSQAHRAKLASGLVDEVHMDSKSTVASSLASKIVDDTSVAWAGRDFSDAVSQTTVHTTIGPEKMQVVPFPLAATYNEEFQCPLCFCIVLIRNWNHWKSHQFRDLQPYVCIYEDCVAGARLYGSHHDWEAHLALHQSLDSSSTSCPLCSMHCEDGNLHVHLGREMQQLALFVVPSELFDGMIDGSDAETPDKDNNTNSWVIERVSSFRLSRSILQSFLSTRFLGIDEAQLNIIEVRNVAQNLNRAKSRQTDNDFTFTIPANLTHADRDALDRHRDVDIVTILSPAEAAEQEKRTNAPRSTEIAAQGKLVASDMLISKQDDGQLEREVTLEENLEALEELIVGQANMLLEREEAVPKVPEEEREVQVQARTSEAVTKITGEVDEGMKKPGAQAEARKDEDDMHRAPIRFIDALGRKFSFPWHRCKTWKSMEALITQAFLHVEELEEHVREGHYDLISSDGEIILPVVWEMIVKPDDKITMQMWPLPEVERPHLQIDKGKRK